MRDIVDRLRELAGETGTFGGDASLFGEAASEITRLQAELSSLKASAKEARAEALEEAAKWHDAQVEDYTKQIAVNDAYLGRGGSLSSGCRANEYCDDMRSTHRRSAAAIRRLKEGATPEPVPSLAKLFDDIAAKQRSINDQFDEFMSDVEGKP